MGMERRHPPGGVDLRPKEQRDRDMVLTRLRAGILLSEPSAG